MQIQPFTEEDMERYDLTPEVLSQFFPGTPFISFQEIEEAEQEAREAL